MKLDIKIAMVTGGVLFQYLKEIELVGRVDEDDGVYRVFGCEKRDEPRFYKGILEYDKATEFHGFETIKDVEEYWKDYGGLALVVGEGDYKIIGDIGINAREVVPE